jgi:hypothetical protein
MALRDQRLRERQRLGRPLRPDHGVAAPDVARKLKFFGSQFDSHREK